jgi:hypothetical protein
VIFHTVDADRLKCTEADVQGDLGGLNATLADSVKNFRCEVKAGGRGGDRSPLLGVDGLIALAVTGGIRARDIRRERDMANAIESGEEILVGIFDRIEADVAFPIFSTSQNLG